MLIARSVRAPLTGMLGLLLGAVPSPDACGGGAITQQAYVKASNTDGGVTVGDSFGSAIAVSGDTMVIGAPFEDSSATGVDGDQADDAALSAGAAYVFVRVDGTWSQQAYLKASNTGFADTFGQSVAISEDTIVVGSPFEDSAATGVGNAGDDDDADEAGAAYVFVRSGSVWSQQAYLKASNTDAGDQFGCAVTIFGDTIVVGASGEASASTGVGGDQEDDSAGFAGAAYVFVRSGSTWTQQAYLKADNAEAGDLFGEAVSLSGDTLLVGAPFEDSAAVGVDGDGTNDDANLSGAAYVFVRSDAAWSQEAYLKASNTDPLDIFGFSVAISDDTAIVGAGGESSGVTGVGSGEDDDGATSAGAAYVFVREVTTWIQQAYLKASNTDADDAFGNAVSISGDTAIVGATGEASGATGLGGSQDDDTAEEAGAAYVFERSGAAWYQRGYLKASNTDAGDAFGRAVALMDDTAVVGATGESSNATGIGGDQEDDSERTSGAAYVFLVEPGDCPDTNGDAVVDADDLVAVILDWGTDGSAFGGDVDGSGLVDADDLVSVILAWGSCG